MYHLLLYLLYMMIHSSEILEGKVNKPGCLTLLSQVRCELHEDNGKRRDYGSWYGILEAVWKSWELGHLTLKHRAYILGLSDGRGGLIFTGKWSGGYTSPQRAQFVGPGPGPFLERIMRWAESAWD